MFGSTPGPPKVYLKRHRVWLAAPPAPPPPAAMTKVARGCLLPARSGRRHTTFYSYSTTTFWFGGSNKSSMPIRSSAGQDQETVPVNRSSTWSDSPPRHSDHAGDSQKVSMFAEGATIVTTPATRIFWKRLRPLRVTLRPNSSSTRREGARKGGLRLANKKRVFQDDKHVVVLHDIELSPTLHADDH